MTSHAHSRRLILHTLQSQILSSNNSWVLRSNLNFTLPQYQLKRPELIKLLRRRVLM